MKKSLTSLSIFILIIFLASCKKVVDHSPFIEIYEQKITQWIDTKVPKNEAGKKYAKELKENLDYSLMREESSLNNEKILVIPIRDNFLESRKTEHGCSGNLVVLIDEKREPRRINIVLFKPESINQTSKLPDNTFYHLFNTSKVAANGQFDFLDINGVLQYQLSYKNKKLISRGVVVPLSKTEYSKLSSQINKGVSLANYLTNNDGNHIQQKTSSDGCAELTYTIFIEIYNEATQTWIPFAVLFYGVAKWCPGEVQVPQPDPNSGSGIVIRFSGPTGANWGTGITYEYAVSKEFIWTAYSLPYGYITSTETVYGKKLSGVVGGGYFTNVTHGSSQSTDGTATWTESGSHYVISSDILYLYLSGAITNSSGTTNINEARNFSFLGMNW